MNFKDKGFYIAATALIILCFCALGIVLTYTNNLVKNQINNEGKPLNAQDVLSGNNARRTVEQNIPQNIPVQQAPQKYNGDANLVNIPVRHMVKLSGMSKAEVLALRKKAVSSSFLFANNTNYVPSSEVFQIDDGLQWIGAHEVSCNGADNNPSIGEGDSRESVGILNPELMLYLNVPNYLFAKGEMGCSEVDYLIPYKITYSKETKTINAHINYTAFKEKNKVFYGIVLEDANAHDLGYNYVKATHTRNVRFKEQNNFSTDVIQARGFYHRGGSCGLPEGCNNYSPYESAYHFYLTALPASIDVKLWKKEPFMPSQQADLNYRLIFE